MTSRNHGFTPLFEKLDNAIRGFLYRVAAFG
jgi:hypothetical protein